MPTKKPDTFTRAAAMRGPRTINDEGRSFEVIAASEAPVKVYDWETGRELDEILIASGFSLPRGRKQVPLQDSHNASTVAATLGSARNFTANGDEVHASVEFATDAESERAFNLYKAGHLTDFSVRYSRDKVVVLDEGKKKTIGGREYIGPAMLVTKWTIKELSPTPIGADERAVARSAESDAEQTNENHQEVEPMPVDKSPQEPVPASRADEGVKPTQAVDLDAIREEATRAEQKRISDIRAACRAANVIDIEDELINSRTTVADAQARIIQELGKKQRPVTVDVRSVADEKDKFRAAVTDGIRMRAGIIVEKPAAGSENFRHRHLLEIGREWLERHGVRTSGMNKMQLAGAMLGMRGEYDITAGTSNFTNILLDAANVSARRGFTEAVHIWDMFCGIGSAPDFKNINRVQLSEAPDLDAINEQGEYTTASFNDSKETYKLLTYGKKFTLSRQALINDSQDMFSRIPRALGAAAQRKIEQLAIAILTANAALADGYNLFDNTYHFNNPTAAALSTTSLNAAICALAKQKGPGEDTAYLSIQPRFLIVPTALQFTADIMITSSSLPEANQSSGVANPYRNMGLMRLSSPILDASSATAWYLAADPNQIDTVEVSFLDGVREPYLEEVDQTDVDGRVYKVRIDCAAKALDFRGLLKNNGA